MTSTGRSQRWSAVSLALFLLIAAAAPAAADTLTLYWDPSPDSNVVGYVVYVGTRSGVYDATRDVGNTTSFTLSNAVAGQPYYFAVAAYAAGPLLGARSAEFAAIIDQPPVLLNPGNQTGVVGKPLSLQLTGSDPAGQAVTYRATSLPPGLALATTTGFISGTPTTAGTYAVTASVDDGALTDTETFAWTISQPAATPTGPVLTITVPLSSGVFTTDKPLVTVGGTVTGTVAVTAVEWVTDRGSRGTATGTNNWLAGVPLKSGQNTVTVKATDAYGLTSSRSIVVKLEKGRR